MWLFGYGSLIWNPAIPFVEQRTARLSGWIRRFYQASPDHRGTPEKPGRVVTLLPEELGYCWGKVYRMPGEGRETILNELDYREKAGYERYFLLLDLADEQGDLTGEQVEALVYVANRQNPNFIGPDTLQEMATHIVTSIGPSGKNSDYLLRLDDALQTMCVPDPHVASLANAVRALLKK